MTGNATIQCTHTGDVCATNSTLKFEAGSEVAEYTFTINSDLLVEGAENFFLQLAGGVGVFPHSKGTLVEVIILDSAAPRELHMVYVCVYVHVYVFALLECIDITEMKPWARVVGWYSC